MDIGIIGSSDGPTVVYISRDDLQKVLLYSVGTFAAATIMLIILFIRKKKK